MNMLAKTEALGVLRSAFGENTSFRSGQWEAIDAVVNRKKRLLVVQRTGWGKSAVYFIACRALRQRRGAFALIVSPLLALMRNQIDAAARFGLRAMKIDSADKTSQEAVVDALTRDALDCLFITPERLANETFRTQVLVPFMERVELLVIDEAHCISDWGHDFRPDYRRLQQIVGQIPKNTPVIATTATANDRVIADIAVQLGNVEVYRGDLGRESLMLDVWTMTSRLERWVWIDRALHKLEGTGLIYAQTVRETHMLADWLRHRGHCVKSYASDIDPQERLQLEDDLQRNRIKALVATSALGMGYDKPDLAFVIHLGAPTSIIAYYQQIGRAGRALEKAYVALLHHPSDERVLRYFWESAFPSEALMNEVLRAIENEPNGLTLPELKTRVNARQTGIQAALTHLSILTPSPVVREDKHRAIV